MDLADKVDKVIENFQEREKQAKLQIDALVRNNMILIEMVHEANDTLNELWKITSTYHPMIIKGMATRDDVKECSNIVQRSLKYFRRFTLLRDLYSKVCGTIPNPDEDFNIIKKDKTEC
jgi:uncharacterized protein (DUF927 family)